MKRHLIIAVGLLLVACGTHKDEEPIVAVTETAEVAEPTELYEPEEVPAERPIYNATETILTDLVHTKLEVNFDWKKSRMNGLATITAKQHFYASDELILDAKGMIINKVYMNKAMLAYTYKEDVLTIKLGREYTRDENYTIVIDYVARPEEREEGGSAAITSDKGLYFINPRGEEPNKMPQIWTQGETESSSVWFPTIDSPNAKTTQEVFITVQDKYTTLSNGKLMSSKKVDGGKRVDHWKQTLPHAPYLFMMGIGEFKIVEDSYTRPDGTKMDVNYYVEKEWEGNARAIFGETPTMIKFFSELTGVEFVWDKYNQIVVREYVSGAMENTGAVIFGDYVYKNDRELLDDNDQSTIAHELFHHWFGDLVTCESWSNLPLNESFANYSQYLWDEFRYGIDEADLNAEAEADGYFQSSQMQGYHDLIWFDFDDKEQMFDGHSYNKGGRILHMLRNYLGDEAFFEGMRNYLEKNKFKPAEFHQLRLAFEEVSGEDLNWFFNQWFLAAGHPILYYHQDIDTVNQLLNITVEQKQDLEESPIFRIPMEIAVFDADGKHLHKIVVDELTEEISLPFSGELKGFIYDNQQMVLGKKRERKSKEMYVFQYYNGERFAARRDGLMKGSNDRSAKGQQMILDALKDPFWGIRIEAVEKASKLKDDKLVEGIAKLKDMANNDPKSSVRAAALNKLGKLMEIEEVEPIYIASIAEDSSYQVVTSALSSLGKENPEKAMELAGPLESERSSSMVSGIGQLYAGFAGPEKFEFFETSFNGTVLQGFDKLGLMSSFTYYISRQDAGLMDRSLPIYEKLLEGGGMYMEMFLPQNLDYIIKGIDENAGELEKELAEYEENNDAAYADQTRKKIAGFNASKVKFNALLKEVTEE
ncbi:MAG: M1 family metallopeptidase [Crocinitomicaceae bacterium]|nr:M1 family metallopeptidase [Crocinitomicaceae bacterium]